MESNQLKWNRTNWNGIRPIEMESDHLIIESDQSKWNETTRNGIRPIIEMDPTWLKETVLNVNGMEFQQVRSRFEWTCWKEKTTRMKTLISNWSGVLWGQDQRGMIVQCDWFFLDYNILHNRTRFCSFNSVKVHPSTYTTVWSFGTEIK